MLQLLDWLRTQDRSLDGCVQADLDRWALEHLRAHDARPFLSWVVARHHAPPAGIAAHGYGTRRAFVASDERWDLARRLLHDGTIDPAIGSPG